MVLEVYFDVNVEAKGLIFDGGIVGALADTDELASRAESKNAVRWLSGFISKSPARVPEWAASFNNGLPQNVVAEYMSPQHPARRPRKSILFTTVPSGLLLLL